MNGSNFDQYINLLLAASFAYLAYRLFEILKPHTSAGKDAEKNKSMLICSAEALRMWQIILQHAHKSLERIETVRTENARNIPSPALLAQCIEIEFAASLLKKITFDREYLDKYAHAMRTTVYSEDELTKRALQIVFSNDNTYINRVTNNVDKILQYSLITGSLKSEQGPYSKMVSCLTDMLCDDCVDCINRYYTLGQELDESMLIFLLTDKQ